MARRRVRRAYLGEGTQTGTRGAYCAGSSFSLRRGAGPASILKSSSFHIGDVDPGVRISSTCDRPIPPIDRIRMLFLALVLSLPRPSP